MELDLRGRVAIVTGGSRGIGREIVEVLAGEEVKVVALDVREEELGALAEAFQAGGRNGLCRRCDVRDPSQVQAAVAETVDAFGRVDILVNNAGVAGGGPVEDLDVEKWRTILDVNLTGPFLTCQAVIPHMKRQRYGRIINAASYAAITPSYGGAAYSASKAGVVYLTRVLAGELGPWNITANSYAPGMVPTQMNHFAELPEDTQETLLDMLSLRQWGAPRDIANLVAFLASEAAGYITGSLIDVSGGKLAVQRPQQAHQAAARSAAQ